MSNPEARKRVLHGVKESDLDSFHTALENAKIKDEQTLWQFLTDKDLLPPYGKNLVDFKKTFMTATVILSFAASNPAFAESPKGEDKIKWAIEALEKISPINILIFQKEKNEARSESKPFSDFEKQVLTWNILYEAGGEKTDAAKLAILLNNLQRMKSKSFPSTAEGIAFQRYQYSWTRDILSGKNAQDRKDIFASYMKIRKLVEDNLVSPTLSGNILSIQGKIEKETGKPFPLGYFYNRADIMPFDGNPVFNKKKFDSLGEDTRQRLAAEAKRIMESGKYQIIENHIHY